MVAAGSCEGWQVAALWCSASHDVFVERCGIGRSNRWNGAPVYCSGRDLPCKVGGRDKAHANELKSRFFSSKSNFFFAGEQKPDLYSPLQAKSRSCTVQV